MSFYKFKFIIKNRPYYTIGLDLTLNLLTNLELKRKKINEVREETDLLV